MNRLADLQRFYEILDLLDARLGGPRRLAECDARLPWPQQGVYFFFEPGERRTHSGAAPRIVRVGTHAVSTGSKATLWRRLAQHRGNRDGNGGNHRGSVFRLLIGAALGARHPELAQPFWGSGQSAPAGTRAAEQPLERAVSQYLGAMPFLWLDAADTPSPQSIRSYIERNSIALLSNLSATAPLDPPSATWLGHHCPHPKVRESGLWNARHVEETYNPAFLDVFHRLALAT